MKSVEGVQSLFDVQINLMTQAWSQAIAKHYPDSLPDWKDPVRHLELMKVTGLGAAQKIDWDRCLATPCSRVLDFGAGSGWLSGLLSTHDRVAQIDALDSDLNNLRSMLPKIVELLGGNMTKIRPLLGLMSPLPLPNASYDVIAASSSIHHVGNLTSTLLDLRRVLKPDGVLLLLNETPRTFNEYLTYNFVILHKILDRVCNQISSEFEESISANGIFYDPKLGDRAFAYYQYRDALLRAGFNHGVIRSGVKAGPLELVHFVCTRADSSKDIHDFGVCDLLPSECDELSPTIRNKAMEALTVLGNAAYKF
jgi:SAM-dependent methyltransferase